MELSAMLVWAAILVSLIVFIVFLVKTFKAWGVGMTIGFVILFIECWSFLILSAGVSSKRLTSLKQFDSLYKQVRELKLQQDEAFFGKYSDPNPDLQYYIPAVNELSRVILERGRAWRGARVAQATPNAVTVELPLQQANLLPPTVPGTPPGAVPPNQVSTEPLAVDSVVYAFGEDQNLLPVTFFGEFKVTTVNGSNLSLVPTSPLLQSQAAAINNNQTWAIYEVMPLDSHTAFARPGSISTNEEVFGTMNPEEISQLLGIPLDLANAEPNSLNINDAIKARVLQSYLRDGSRAPDGTPLNLLVYEVTFLQDFTIDVDANEQRNAKEGGYFDLSGRSIDARLKRNPDEAPFVFKANEAGAEPYRLDGFTAKQLESEGKVKLGAAIFVRLLNDYEFAFREARRLTLQAQQEAVLVNREVEVVTKSNKFAEEQLLAAEDTNRRLEKDKGQYDKEFSVIDAESKRLNDAIAAKKAELSQLYAQIQQNHSALVTIQTTIANALDGN